MYFKTSLYKYSKVPDYLKIIKFWNFFWRIQGSFFFIYCIFRISQPKKTNIVGPGSPDILLLQLLPSTAAPAAAVGGAFVQRGGEHGGGAHLPCQPATPRQHTRVLSRPSQRGDAAHHCADAGGHATETKSEVSNHYGWTVGQICLVYGLRIFPDIRPMSFADIRQKMIYFNVPNTLSNLN